jgi:hypothetical protein
MQKGLLRSELLGEEASAAETCATIKD